MFNGSIKWLEARVDGLEKTIDKHMKECADLARENRDQIKELMRLSNENARACIATAEGVRDQMQKTFLKYLGGAVLLLVGALEAMLRLHV